MGAGGLGVAELEVGDLFWLPTPVPSEKSTPREFLGTRGPEVSGAPESRSAWAAKSRFPGAWGSRLPEASESQLSGSRQSPLAAQAAQTVAAEDP